MTTRLLILGLLACLAAPALAEESPVAGKKDPRMRTVIYDPTQVVRLSTGVGATLVITFSTEEKVTAVAVTDSKDLAVNPRDNFLFVKSHTALPPQPIVVLTAGPTGTRRYVFEVETVPMSALTADKSDLYYSVEFTYPKDEAMARAKAEKKRAADKQEHEAEAALAQVHTALEEPLNGQLNYHYVGQGDQSLLPLEVFDNGYTTSFRFPGNTRIPGIFKIDPDGKEATANYSVKGDYISVGSVAAGWRLRDGDTVLCIWNRAYDKVGLNPQTGTTSADVKRVTKEAPK